MHEMLPEDRVHLAEQSGLTGGGRDVWFLERDRWMHLMHAVLHTSSMGAGLMSGRGGKSVGSGGRSGEASVAADCCPGPSGCFLNVSTCSVSARGCQRQHRNCRRLTSVLRTRQACTHRSLGRLSLHSICSSVRLQGTEPHPGCQDKACHPLHAACRWQTARDTAPA